MSAPRNNVKLHEVPEAGHLVTTKGPGDIQKYRHKDGHICAYWFACPGCGKPRNVPVVAMYPGQPTWAVRGDPEDIEHLTLTPSVWDSIEGGCGWHGWIQNGEAVSI